MEKLDILLTTPHYEEVSAVPRTTRSTCVGLSYIKSYMNQVGIKSKIIDPYGLKKGFEDAMAMIKDHETPIYGISATFATQQKLAKMCQAIKSYNPRSNIIVGGWSAFNYAELMASNPEIDYFVVGPGELTTPRLVSALLSGDLNSIPNIPGIAAPRIGFTGPARIVTNLDDLLTPDVSDTPPFQMSEYSHKLLNYYSSRGCLHNTCRFCSIGLMHESYRAMSPKKVAEDLARYFEIYPDINVISLADDLFDIRRFEGILPEMEKRGIRTKFLFQSSAQNVCANEALLKDPAVAERIERTDIGIETFSGTRLKFFAKPSTPEMNWRAIEIVTSSDVDSLAYTILDDSISELKRTRERYVHPSFWPKNVWMNSLCIFPHTKLDQAWYQEVRKPWQSAFHTVMRSFHQARKSMHDAARGFKPGLKKYAGDPTQKELWEKFNKKQETIDQTLNSLVVEHFDAALEVAMAVHVGRLKPDSPEVNAVAEEYKQKFSKTLDSVWAVMGAR
jgi:hypothetical protein